MKTESRFKIKCIENSSGDKLWYRNGVYHREDGPAIERCDGQKEWWINGARHRTDGPAIECAVPNCHGTKYWWYYRGFYCSRFSKFAHLAKLPKDERTFLLLKYF